MEKAAGAEHCPYHYRRLVGLGTPSRRAKGTPLPREGQRLDEAPGAPSAVPWNQGPLSWAGRDRATHGDGSASGASEALPEHQWLVSPCRAPYLGREGGLPSTSRLVLQPGMSLDTSPPSSTPLATVPAHEEHAARPSPPRSRATQDAPDGCLVPRRNRPPMTSLPERRYRPTRRRTGRCCDGAMASLRFGTAHRGDRQRVVGGRSTPRAKYGAFRGRRADLTNMRRLLRAAGLVPPTGELAPMLRSLV